MKKRFKLFFVVILFIFASNANANTTANIHVDDIVIKDLTNPQVVSSAISEDEHKRLVYKLSSDAQEDFISWCKRQGLFIAVFGIVLVIALIKLIWNLIEDEVKKNIEKEIQRSNKFIDNAISSLDKKREEVIETTAKTKHEIDIAQETLKEFRKKEIEINKKIENFQNEIETKEKEISNINLNLDSIKKDLESKVEAETARLEQKINVLRLIIKKLDMNGDAVNQVIDELILDLNGNDEKLKYNAVELLPQFEIDSNKIENAFVTILKDNPDTTFESLLLSGLSELKCGSATLEYLLEAVNDLTSPNISAIIGAIGKVGEDGKTKIVNEGELKTAVNKLLSILNDDIDNKIFSKEAEVKASDVKIAISLALLYYGKKATTAEADIIKLLNDKEPHVRKNAAIALGQIGTKNAVPPLQQLKNDESIEVRDAVSKAIEEIQDRS